MIESGKGNTQRLRSTRTPGFYACFVPAFIDVAREHGYALGFHGSMATDFDIMAVPWTEEATSGRKLVEALAERVGVFAENGDKLEGPTERPHGRQSWAIVLGSILVFDISVYPVREDDHAKT